MNKDKEQIASARRCLADDVVGKTSHVIDEEDGRNAKEHIVNFQFYALATVRCVRDAVDRLDCAINSEEKYFDRLRHSQKRLSFVHSRSNLI